MKKVRALFRFLLKLNKIRVYFETSISIILEKPF